MKIFYKQIIVVILATAIIILNTAFSGFNPKNRYDSDLENFISEYKKFVNSADAEESIETFKEAYTLLIENYLKPIDNNFKTEFFARGIDTLNKIKQAQEKSSNNLAEIINEEDLEGTNIVNNNAKQLSAKDTMEILMAVMFNQIDAHTLWLSPTAAEQFKQQLAGKHKGIGILFSSNKEDNSLNIKKVFDKSGASIAGLKIGDKITYVNDVKIILGDKYENLEKIVNSIRGVDGTTVKLTVERKQANGKSTDLTLTVKRGDYYIPSVESVLIDNKYAYINITSFNKDTYSLYKNAISSYDLTLLEGLIIDLRSNPGGLLDQALAVGNTVLSGEEIVSIKGRTTEKTISYYSFQNILVPSSLPIVILIDAQSASAAELLSASFALNNRAILIGDYTFGKWSVQASYTLSNKSVFNITTQIFYSPFNSTFQGTGIAPDINILPTRYFKNNTLVSKNEFEELRKKEFRENNYTKALVVDNINSINRKPKLIVNEKQCPIYNEEDYILGCAIVYLKHNNMQKFYNAINSKNNKQQMLSLKN